jgi:hypothetical protein
MKYGCASCSSGETRDDTYSLLLLEGSGALGTGLLLALSLLEESLRDQDLVVGGDGTISTRLVHGPAYRGRYGTERRWKNCS